MVKAKKKITNTKKTRKRKGKNTPTINKVTLIPIPIIKKIAFPYQVRLSVISFGFIKHKRMTLQSLTQNPYE